MIDERRGVPSASSLYRVVACPASPAMEAQCHEPPESPEASSGTRIHNVLAGIDDEYTLTADEMTTAEMCAAQEIELRKEWMGEEPVTGLYKEKRLGLTALGKVMDVTPESKAAFIFTGQADWVIVEGKRAFCADWKTGRGEVADALNNPQLASLAVLVAGRHGVTSVRVAIVQPWAGKPTVCDYDEAALAGAKRWLLETLRTAEEATPASLRAGDHCKYCKAQSVCPAFRDITLQSIELVEPMSIAGMDGKTQRAAMFARCMEVTPASLAASVRGLAMVERYVDAVKGAAKARAENDPEFQRFFVLKQKAGRRSISDVKAVFQRAAAQGVTADAFTEECSIGISAVTDLVKASTKKKGKDLESTVATILDGAVTLSNPSMELVAADSITDKEV